MHAPNSILLATDIAARGLARYYRCRSRHSDTSARSADTRIFKEMDERVLCKRGSALFYISYSDHEGKFSYQKIQKRRVKNSAMAS